MNNEFFEALQMQEREKGIFHKLLGCRWHVENAFSGVLWAVYALMKGWLA